MESALSLSNVTKTFGKVKAVDGLSLEVPAGSIYGFIGPNGAGKTTTIRMILSILKPDAGAIRVLGHPDAAAVKDRLGYLPEERGLYKKMRVGEILVYFASLKGVDGATATRRARELLERFAEPRWFELRCEALSKGMGQKVQLLGTLIHDPALVILDEPFSGLDPVNVELLREIILDHKRRGATVIFCTHVMEQAEQICDFIVLFNRGKKVLDGLLSAIKADGQKGVLLDYDGDGGFLAQLPGVRRVNDAGKQAEIFLDEGVDPQTLLRAIVDRVRVRRFDFREPSLHEIFVRAVGPRGAEDGNHD